MQSKYTYKVDTCLSNKEQRIIISQFVHSLHSIVVLMQMFMLPLKDFMLFGGKGLNTNEESMYISWSNLSKWLSCCFIKNMYLEQFQNAYLR